MAAGKQLLLFAAAMLVSLWQVNRLMPGGLLGGGSGNSNNNNGGTSSGGGGELPVPSPPPAWSNLRNLLLRHLLPARSSSNSGSNSRYSLSDGAVWAGDRSSSARMATVSVAIPVLGAPAGMDARAPVLTLHDVPPELARTLGLAAARRRVAGTAEQRRGGGGGGGGGSGGGGGGGSGGGRGRGGRGGLMSMFFGGGGRGGGGGGSGGGSGASNGGGSSGGRAERGELPQVYVVLHPAALTDAATGALPSDAAWADVCASIRVYQGQLAESLAIAHTPRRPSRSSAVQPALPPLDAPLASLIADFARSGSVIFDAAGCDTPDAPPPPSALPAESSPSSPAPTPNTDGGDAEQADDDMQPVATDDSAPADVPHDEM